MFFNNIIRVNRAGRIAKNSTKLEQLKQSSYKDDKTKKQIVRLTSQIAKDQERQKIASENNLKSKSQSKTYNYNSTKTTNNGINTSVNFNKNKKK